MARPGRRGRPAAPPISSELDQLANSLAERDQRGEIKLSREGLELIRAINQGKDYEAVANSLAERDERGQVRLSREVLELVQGILGGSAPSRSESQQRAADRSGHATEVLRGKGGLFAGRKRI